MPVLTIKEPRKTELQLFSRILYTQKWREVAIQGGLKQRL